MPTGATAAPRPAPSGLRVMIVDDSAVVRGFMSQWLGSEPGIAVVGAAGNGRDALAVLAAAAPDIVLLDLDMPVINGFDALPALLDRRPGLSVVIVSTLTRPNAEASLACLAKGAVDYVTKPETRRDFAGPTAFRQELVHKVRGLAGRHGRAEPPGSAAGADPGLRRRSPPGSSVAAIRPRVVAVGASTGGPQALAEVLRGLSEVSKAVPILVVQHMPEIFTAVFAEQLRTQTGLDVGEARDGEAVRPGRVYLAPGGRHMRLAAGKGGVAVRLDAGPPVQHCRPAVDVTFGDVARIFGPASLGIVLTGMGADGTEGARALVAAGGSVIAQDEPTSLVWGMPGSVAKAGLACRILPLAAVAGAVRNALGLRW